MKTAVIMKRDLFGFEISQHSKTGYFSMTDLVRAGNMYRESLGEPSFDPFVWIQGANTKSFMSELEMEFGVIKISNKGRGKHTWLHPLLFIDMALAISPKMKVLVYKWLKDNLILVRNDSGDSYKRMASAIYKKSPNEFQFEKDIVHVAVKIRKTCGVTDWQTATEDQLKMRDKCHENVALLVNVLDDLDNAVNEGLFQAKKEYDKKNNNVISLK